MSYKRTNEELIQMITITYTSQINEQIRTVQSLLIDYVIKDYSRSILQLENILAKYKNIDNNCKKAIVNLLQVAVKQIMESLCLLGKREDDGVSQHKKLLFAVQHIFDNKEIDTCYKLPVGHLYVDLFILFSPQNYARLLSKSKYYFNIKEYLLALILTQAYIDKKTPLKYRFPYCQDILQIILCNSLKKIDTVIAQQNCLSSKSQIEVNKLMQALQDLWRKMTFEKFESLFHKIYTSDIFIRLIQGLNHLVFGNRWQASVNTIFNIITFSLGRCNLFPKYPLLMGIIQKISLAEFNKLMSGELALQKKCEAASLSLIATALEYKLIHVQVQIIDVYQKLIYSNFMHVQRYFEEQAQNLPQIINFVDDASFYLQSQMPQILRHKIFINLCKTHESIFLSFKFLLQSFYLSHSLQQQNRIKQPIFIPNLAQWLNTWSMIQQTTGKDGHLQIVMLYSALTVSLFMSNFSFMKVIQQFLCLNCSWLLQNSNKRIVFYCLVLYKNYMDDIFNNNSSTFFKQRLFMLALNLQSHNQLISQFIQQVIRERFSQNPTYQQISHEISLILNKMIKLHNPKFVPVLSTIFLQYGQMIKSQTAIKIIKDGLSFWQQLSFQHYGVIYLQFFKAFFKVDSAQPYFLSLVEQLLRFANQHHHLIQNDIEQFIDVMGTALKICKSLPYSFELTLIKFEIIVSDTKMMDNINNLIMYSNSEQFFNWAAFMLTKNNLNLQQILLLHNLIYFGHTFLNQDSIQIILSKAYLQRISKSTLFDYRNGKLSLIFLYLLSYAWDQTNKVLMNYDWTQTVNKGRQLLKNVDYLRRKESVEPKPFIQQIYDLIYAQDNIYRWSYDIQMFIIHQIELLKCKLKDHYQFSYANLSFIACTMNILRANKFIEEEIRQDGSESDDSLNPHTPLEKEYRKQQSIMNKFMIPAHLRTVDYFTSYRKFITNLKKDDNSNKWMQTIFKAILRQKQKVSFLSAMKMEKSSEGKYRQINKIRPIHYNNS